MHKMVRIAELESPPSTTVALSPDGHWLLCAKADQETSKIMLVEDFRW